MFSILLMYLLSCLEYNFKKKNIKFFCNIRLKYVSLIKFIYSLHEKFHHNG